MVSDLDYAKGVLEAEARAVASLVDRLDASFEGAVEAILACRGHVIVTGMGKAGIIAQKISATLASTGTPSHYLHPVEAIHGDLGRVRADDLVLILSNSGETEEIVRLLPALKRIGARTIGMMGRTDSSLGRHTDVALGLGDITEACPMGLAPSASTTAMLALGDALALTVVRRRGFGPADFALNHPGGALGRRFLQVRDVMRQGPANPLVATGVAVKEALVAITGARAGAAGVVDGEGRLVGIFTDGDLRRLLRSDRDLASVTVGEVMTRDPKTVGPEQLVAEALRVLQQHRIDELPVVDESGRPLGMLDVQDALGAQVL